jgi:hypothetical protein
MKAPTMGSVLLLSILAAPLVAVTVAQPPTPKPAWQWTDEERVTARTVVSNRHPLSAESSSVSGDRNHFVIDGLKNPELFMPSELYNSLTYGLWEDQRVRTETRAKYKPAIQRLGWDEETFWNTLERFDRRHQELQRRLLSRDLTPDESFRLSTESCGARVAAFRAAQAAFGREKLLEFLYIAVAPGISITAKVGTDEQRRLRWVEGGCQ